VFLDEWVVAGTAGVLPSDADDGDVGNRLIHEVGHLATGRQRVLEQWGAEDRASVLSGRAGLDPDEQFGGHCRLLGVAQSLKRGLGDDDPPAQADC
jgi:hypothetical protein